jgi:hypothetical protein
VAIAALLRPVISFAFIEIGTGRRFPVMDVNMGLANILDRAARRETLPRVAGE